MPVYKQPMMKDRVNTLKHFIRHPYAFPGGYQIVGALSDGEAICHKCTQENYCEILHSTMTGSRDGWAFSHIFINYEDPNLYCVHCGERIESEYAEEEAPCLS